MKEVKVVIKMKMKDEVFLSDEFQDFLLSIKNGEMKREMNEKEEGETMFDKISIFYFVNEKSPAKNERG